MNNIRLAVPNIFCKDAATVAHFAKNSGFGGVDWSLGLNLSEGEFLEEMAKLRGFEVRYHCFWPRIDIAYADQRADQAMHLYKQVVRLVSKANGRYITIHIGLGQSSSEELDWEKAIMNLSNLVRFGREREVTMCLENITGTWTSDPKKFRILIESTGAGVTLDIGHVYACRKDKPIEDFFESYVLPNKDLILNAHIYHTEIAGKGHVAPQSLDQIFDRLRLLRSVTNCDWWVIELPKAEDILKTRDLLIRFLSSF